MIFADAGWFIALVDPKDGLHLRPIRWFHAVDQPIITTRYVLPETFNALSDLAKRRRCHELLASIISESDVSVVTVTPDLFDLGVHLHRERSDKTWSLTDCISFVLMQQQGVAAALAHDHHFEQAGYEALLRREPG